MDHELRYRGIIPAPETEPQKKRYAKLKLYTLEEMEKEDRYRALLLPPLVRNGELARLMVAYQKATPEERPALEAEYDRLFPPKRPAK